MPSDRTRSVNDAVGEFVIADEELGFGRLLGETNGIARVQYFKGPSTDPSESREFPLEEVKLAKLPTQTRVYIRNGDGWLTGRVEGERAHNGGQCVIALPNQKGEVLSVSEFEVRWGVPVDNPFEILGAFGGESAVVYEQRADVLRGWHRQRAASTGVEGLFLGSVDLQAHQMSVVRRAAGDATRRYLLADEVGLGKTIEAGALIRQHLERHPGATVLILAPDQIRQQWKDELRDKFSIDTSFVLAHDKPGSWPEDAVDILVIDEAHHLTRSGGPTKQMVEKVTRLAHGADQVFLLSATPVRSNEAGFLDLLHLLDPENYSRDDLEGFVDRVKHRDRLAFNYRTLTPDLDPEEMGLIVDGIIEIFPDDRRLSELLAEAESCTDAERAEKVFRVREHLSETYRIHRRLLRTRRTPEIAECIRGRQRGTPFNFEVPDEGDGARESLLDGFGLHLSTLIESSELSVPDAVEAFRDVADRCGSTPHALLAVAGDGGVDRKGSGSTATNPAFTEWARSAADADLSRIEVVLADVTERLSRLLCDEILSKQQKYQKVVVFSSFTETASSVAEAVTNSWSAERVTSHLQTKSMKENAAAISHWIKDPFCTLLFCDRSAEEGVNLQTADLLIHLDLPWQSSRLEQRIGRCDRYVGKGAQPIPSAAVHYGEQPYSRSWFAFLADGCRVFDESISSLQYVLADTEFELLGRVLTDGPAVLNGAIAEQAGQLDNELQNIKAHDDLDSFYSDDDETETNDAVLACDDDRSFTRALKEWLEGVNVGIRSPLQGVVELRRKQNARPHVPLSLERKLTPWFEQRLAVTRDATVEHGYPILRAGHPLIDALADHLERTDRGIVFAFYRPMNNIPAPVVIFRTDFLVSVGPNRGLLQSAEEFGLGSWVRQKIGAVMPPTVERVFLTTDGGVVRREEVIRPYDKSRGDRNLISRPELFVQLTDGFDWTATCASALERARSELETRPCVSVAPGQASEKLRREINLRTDRHTARREAEFGTEEHAILEGLSDSVPDQLEHETLVLGCGAIILAEPQPTG